MPLTARRAIRRSGYSYLYHNVLGNKLNRQDVVSEQASQDVAATQ